MTSAPIVIAALDIADAELLLTPLNRCPPWRRYSTVRGDERPRHSP